MKILLFFIALNFFNVIIQTCKSLLTVKGDKWSASLTNGITYFVYTYVLIYMQIDGLSTLLKAIIVGLCNVFGVFLVKLIEEKACKDKLWLYQCTAKVDGTSIQTIAQLLKQGGVKSVYVEVVPNELYSLQAFAYTQKESQMICSILRNYDIKYCAFESKAN